MSLLSARKIELRPNCFDINFKVIAYIRFFMFNIPKNGEIQKSRWKQ